MPICIITPSGMICEATSYHRPYYDNKGNPKGSEVSKDSWHRKTMGKRIAKLMKLAGVGDGPFMIIKRPTA